MFERFTDDARKVVVQAQGEARALAHTYIGTEHVLLGLLATAGTAAQALGTLGVTLAMTRERVVEIVGRGNGVVSPHIPFTPRAKEALERSLEESRLLGHPRIGPEDILLGVARVPDGVAAEILRTSDATYDAIRSVLSALPTEVPDVLRTVLLRPMTPGEFEAYLGWVVADYAAELERNRKTTGEAAMTASRASFDGLLPDGVATPRQTLLIAEDAGSGERVGLLWFGPSTDDAGTAWIYDITVDEARRGKGWGRAIMRAFEAEARRRGYRRGGLNVYADNHVARRLYESLGYLETARQLSKDLAVDIDPDQAEG